MNPKAREIELYESVQIWLGRYLKAKHRGADVRTYDTHSIQLSNLVVAEGIQPFFPDYAAYEIKVDVTGLILSRSKAKFVFVECKIGPITLLDVGQLLGYSLVAQPEIALLISPEGLSDRLSTLLLTLGRTDILAYARNKSLRIATWNSQRNEIELSTLLPKGLHS